MALATLGTQTGQVETIIHSVPYHNDPLSIMEQICDPNTPALLLESAEIDSKDNLKSLLMTSAAVKIECWADKVEVSALTNNGKSVLPVISRALEDLCQIETNLNETNFSLRICIPPRPDSLDEDARLKALSVFDVLRVISSTLEPIRDIDNAVFLGGVFGYDVFATYEALPEVPTKENTCPDYLFYLAETLITFDHQKHIADIAGSVFSGEDVAQNYFAVSQHIDTLKTQLASLPEKYTKKPNQGSNTDLTLVTDKSDEQYKNDVLKLKENILAGDIFQVVPSRTFSLPCEAPLEAYRCLKQQNPSPYMFYLQTPEFSLFGASPESALKYTASTNDVEVYPIAGTRPRGKNPDGSPNPDLDSRLELSLREDNKEKAEHIMLVDLARNDVAKVSRPGTRHVKELLNVDRYSHVMHLVSRVVGKLRSDLDALHAYQACMNMGTLVGAPKVSAAALIRQVEQKRRGSYGGAVGYLNGNGDMDTCIVIRAAFVRNGIAHVQAGAGVVHDSVPQAEADETRAKAQAVITAVKTASGANSL